MKINWNTFFKVTISAGYTFLILINPMGALSAAKQALGVCANSIIPALFPFFVCSGLLVELGVAGYLSRLLTGVMKPVFKLSGGSSFAMIMGLISGYPVGAKQAAELVRLKICSPSEGEKLLAFCNNSGPLFILGAVGSGMLGKPEIGILLYAAHFLSSITIALLMRNVTCEIYDRKLHITNKANRAFGEILTACIKNAAEMVFTISGFVVIFAILLNSIEQMGAIAALASYGMDYGVVKAIVFGLFEPASGCLAAADSLKSHPVVLYLILSAIIGWSGISVHLQVLGIIKNEKLSPKFYFIGKSLMTVIAPIYMVILMRIFAETIGAKVISVTSMFNIPKVYCSAGVYFAFTLAMTAAFVVLLLIYYVLRKYILRRV